MASCLLVSISSMFIQSANISKAEITWLVVRDLLIATMHTTLIGIFGLYSICSEESSLRVFLVADIVLCVLRIIKNVAYFYASRLNNRNVANAFTAWIYSQGLCIGISLYAAFDFLTYFLWLYGTFGSSYYSELLGDPSCPGFLNSFVLKELLVSNIFYVSSMILLLFTFATHFFSKGFCCPGLYFHYSDWPDSCPSPRFNREAWRTQGESRESYRERARVIFYRQIQAAPITRMEHENRGLSQSQIESLPIIRFNQRERHIIQINPIDTLPKEPPQLEHKSTDIVCTICLSEYIQDDHLRQLCCDHRYHKACIDKWFEERSFCPVCNTEQ